MDELISKEIFDELVQTGRIRLEPAEAEKIRAEMNRQMEVIRQLEAIPPDESLRPVIHGNPYPAETRCALRDDTVRPFENADAIIREVPAVRDGYIISPDIQYRKIG